MRARKLSDLLKKGDRVAVSNITGREASKVCAVSQKYCGNIVGGWALGRDGEAVDTAAGPIPVFGTFEELLRRTPQDRQPNKILVYSPPEAVYGEVKEIVHYGQGVVETIYIITEHVSIEVTAKIHQICEPRQHRRGGLQHPGDHQQPRPGAHRGGGRRQPRRVLPARLGGHHLQLGQHGEHHGQLPAVRRHRHLLRHLHRQGPPHPLPAQGFPCPGPAGRGHPPRRAVRGAGRAATSRKRSRCCRA